jgi:hypothetical protein
MLYRKLHNNGLIQSEEYINKKYKLHRGYDWPAYIEYFETGNLRREMWCIDGIQIRLKLDDEYKPKPSEIIYNENGTIQQENFDIRDESDDLIHNGGPEFIIRLNYILRRSLKKFKRNKKKQIESSLKELRIIKENGKDIFKLIVNMC